MSAASLFPPVPETMAQAAQWLLWKRVPGKPGRKDRKVPYWVGGTPRSDQLDTEEDCARLTTLSVAMAYVRQHPGEYAGLGFALNRGWQGVDLDDVELNGTTDLVEALKAVTYVELSPSGKGVHAIGFGESFSPLASNGSGIEAYSSGRFFATTLKQIGQLQEFRDLAPIVQSALASRHSRTRSLGEATLIPPQSALQPKTVACLRSALNALDADDRDLWVRVGLALKPYGNVGHGLWADWSQKSDKWDADDAARVWRSLKPRGDIGIESIFFEAQRVGWLNPESLDAQILTPGTPHRAEGEWINGDWWPDAPLAAPPALMLRRADSIAMESVYWAWPGLVAYQFLNLLVGETSAGKSTVLAFMVATVTTGRPWPGEDPATPPRIPGRVLWLGSEDPMEVLTVPRLRACGADLSRVTEIQGVTRHGQRATFSLQDDFLNVKRELESARAAGHPYAMLVIDPITSYLHGGKLRRVDMNDSGQLRTVLEPWTVLAKETGIAIVGVTHLAKDTTRSLLHRVLGGGAFAHLCRSLIAVVARPDEGQFARALLQVKSNLPDSKAGAWRFCTAQKVVGQDQRGRDVQANFPVWDRFDPSLTPEAVAGGARGPVSTREPAFGMWVRAQFPRDAPYDELPASELLERALESNIVSRKWRNEHSANYLEKRNFKGEWMCRPKAT